ncbi:MAG TPA: SRPBCC domain-containing protein [Candidatus Acidoferrales bacterium]|nr:SRPBCC domain-containing protein [Candidatus Acidoferrales bacterium]
MAEKGSAADAGMHELVLTREFDAPRALVFEVWSKPEHFKKWFAPNGFTVSRCEMDLRPGGKFVFAFRGPDGKDYPSEGEYVAIEPPSRLAW